MRLVVLDLGNTALKVGVFQQDVLIDRAVFQPNELQAIAVFCAEQLAIGSAFFAASVASIAVTEKLKTLLPLQTRWLDQSMNLPIFLEYPRTSLGVDRIANAAGVERFSLGSPAIIVDLGTCLKIDFVKDKTFLGGNISLGYAKRLQALADYTGKLPLLMPLEYRTDVMQNTTQDCMYNATYQGVLAEIFHFIALFQKKYPENKVFLTGGEKKYFENRIRSHIFVQECPDLTLWGLRDIFFYNL